MPLNVTMSLNATVMLSQYYVSDRSDRITKDLRAEMKGVQEK